MTSNKPQGIKRRYQIYCTRRVSGITQSQTFGKSNN